MNAYPEDALNYDLYRRPAGRVSRTLGPLPDGLPVIKGVEAYAIAKSLPAQGQLAMLTVVGAIAAALLSAKLLPKALVNPFMASLDIFTSDTTANSPVYSLILTISAAVMIVLILILIAVKLAAWGITGGITDTAVSQEQRFRSGAENWTQWQRIKSCALPGLCTEWVIVWPVPIVVGMAIVSALTTRVYLREYSSSGDTIRATLAAAKFYESCGVSAATIIALAASVQVASFFI